MKLKTIKNWNCYILNSVMLKSKGTHQYIKNNNPVVIYWGISKDNIDLVKNIYNYMEKDSVIGKNTSYIIIAYEVPNWNDYFSPWIYEINDKNVFNGYGTNTLQWISESINIIEDMYDICTSLENRYIMGYSLSGLFSLWMFYESGLFGGVASCSGSLWFPRWKEYVENNNEIIQHISKIYLSLGKKEEKTKNQIMRKVGDITRWHYNILKDNKNVEKFDFKWHNGGHFHEVDKRIISGIEWLLRD